MSLELLIPLLACLAGGVWYTGVLRGQRDYLRHENERLTTALGVVHDRLYGAFKDGYQIPDAPLPKEKQRVEFGEGIRRFLADYDEAGQNYYRQQVLALQSKGMDDVAVLREITRGQAMELDA